MCVCVCFFILQHRVQSHQTKVPRPPGPHPQPNSPSHLHRRIHSHHLHLHRRRCSLRQTRHRHQKTRRKQRSWRRTPNGVVWEAVRRTDSSETRRKRKDCGGSVGNWWKCIGVSELGVEWRGIESEGFCWACGLGLWRLWRARSSSLLRIMWTPFERREESATASIFVFAILFCASRFFLIFFTF